MNHGYAGPRIFRAYDTLATFRAEEIIPLIVEAFEGEEPGPKTHVVRSIDWFNPIIQFKVRETRLHPFTKSLVCYKCGRVGTFFALQRGSNRVGPWGKWHLNFYAPGGVMMTCDHIIPKSGGGTDDLENLGTLCCKCNSRKGSKSLEEFLAIPLTPTKEGK